MLLEIFWLSTFILSLFFSIIFVNKNYRNFYKFFFKILTIKFLFLTFFILTIFFFFLKNCIFSITSSFKYNEFNPYFSETFFKLLIIMFLFLFLCIILAISTKEEKNINTLVLIFFSSSGYIMAICSNTWIQLLFSLELANLPLVLLIAKGTKSYISFEGSIKYFVTNSIIGAFFLIGLTIFIKENNLFLINYFLYVINIDLLGKSLLLILILTYLFAKLPLFPLQKPVIDAYSITNNNVLLFVLIFPKITVLYLITNIFGKNDNVILFYFIMIITLLTMLFCIFFAYFQVKIRKFVVYTSIFHNAFFTSILLTNNKYSNIYLITSVLLYAIIISGFLVLISTLKKTDQQYIDNFNVLLAITNSYPMHSKHLLLNLISMAGLPPFAGFFMKYYIINVFLNNSLFIMIGILLLLSIPILYTYLRMIQILYLKKTLNKQKNILLLSTSYSIAFFFSILQISNIAFIKYGYIFILFLETLNIV